MGSLFRLNENDNNAGVVARSNVGSGTLYHLYGAGAQETPRSFQTAAQQTENIRANQQAAQKTGAPVLGAKSRRKDVGKKRVSTNPTTFWYNDQNTPNFDPATAGDAIENLTKTKTIVAGAGRGGGRTTTREIQVPTLAGRINGMTTGALENSAGGMLSAAGTVVSGLSALNGGQNQAVRNLGQGLNRAADAVNKDAAKQTDFAKENTNAAGRFLVDVGTAGTQMLADAGTAALTGGSALVPMFLRSFGGGAQEARQVGKGVGTQLVYGLGEGAIQAGTEKIFNVGSAFSKMFGKGVADDVLKGFINKATSSATGRAFLTAGASAAGEGFEEFVGDILEPILKRATDVDSTARFNLGEAAYDAAIGAALGGVGAASDISAGIRQGRIDRADSAINNVYDAMKQNGMFSQEARDAAEQARGKFIDITPKLTTADGTWLNTKGEKQYSGVAESRQAEFQQADQIARKYGAKLQVSTLGEGVSGQYANGTITIDPGTKNPVRQVLVHELTHHLETSGNYADFQKTVLDYIANDMGVDVGAMKQAIIQEYGQGGVTLNEDGATRELVAKYAESKLFQDEAAINRLARTDRNLFQRIYDWIKDAAVRLTGTSEEKFIRNAERMYQNALESVNGTQGAAEAQNLYAGQNAQTADFLALEQAVKMESAGQSNKDIRRETGWFRGMDGKWRYEIDDSGMQYSARGDLGFRERNANYDRYRTLTRKAEDAMLFDKEVPTAAEIAERKQLEQVYGNPQGIPKGSKLGDYIKHEALFEAYPELKNATLQFADMDTGTQGRYNPDTNVITISEKLRNAPQETLIHEVQHAVQNAEGFSKGASPEYWENRVQKAYNSYINTAGEIEARDAASRRSMTPEQRMMKAPDLGDENTVFTENAGTSAYINPDFKSEIDKWDGAEEKTFHLGTTSEALQSIGVKNRDIQMSGDAISHSMKKHKGMTLDIIKQIPEVLENPVAVMKSRTVEDRITMFGEIVDQNGAPVLAIMEVNPKRGNGQITDINIVNNAYGKDRGIENFLKNSEFLYLDPNKNRTNAWMHGLGLQLPSGTTKYGSIGRVSYADGDVKIQGVPWENLVSQNSQRSSFDELVRSIRNSPLPKAMQDDLIQAHAQVRNKTAKTITEDAEIGTRPGETVRKAPENGTGGTEDQARDIMPKLDGGTDQEHQSRDYLDALADDKNAPTIKKENRPTMAKKDLRADVLNLFSVPAGSRKALGEAIDRAGAEMLRTGGVTEENREKLMDALYDAGVTVRDADPAYKAVRDDLMGRRIYVDESTRADLGDDWKGLTGRALGNGFSLTTDKQKGTSVDQIMQEMAGRFGEGLFDELSDSSTALRELVDMAEAGKPEHIGLSQEAEDLGRQYGEGAVEDHADNLRRQMNAALQRFAEKAGLEIKLKDRSDAAVAKEREHWKELLQRSNDRGRERLKNQKTHYQDVMQRKKERHERSVAATQTQRSLRYLRRRLGYHDTKLAEALDSLSAEDRKTAEYALQNIADNAKSLTTEASEKLKANAERYKALVENDKNYIPDKETLEKLERMDRAYLADLSVEELAREHRVIQSLRTHLADMDREIGREHGRQIETIYQQSKAEIQGSRGRKPASKARRKTAEFTDSQLTPMNRLKQLGGWKDGAFYSMAEQLEAGERARKEFEVKANRLLKNFREKNADWIAKSDGQGKNATWYELEVPELLEWGKGDKPIFGDTVKVSLTPAMRVELARGVRNYDNLRHAEGGVTFPNRTLYSRGERAEAYARGTTIKLPPETMKKLFSYENLTAEEKELYRLGDQFFNKMAKDAINKTSQEMDGVDRAMSQYYSKIYTNASYRPTDVTTVDQSLGGMGSLQKRVQSKAPMLAVSMWEAYADTIDTVGKYSGLSIPVRNMNMLYNWMESGQNVSLKSVLENKWGTDSTKFMENLLKNLQNKQVLDKSGVDALADYFLKNYVTATFGANPGIVLKQATSFPSGAAVLGWDTIPTPKQMRKVDTELIAKYTPELEYRSMGYATPELAELKNNPNWTQRNKFTRFVFGGAIQAMDRATVKCMWPWAENAVRKHYSDLEPGSDAFYRKTAELFNKAVSETQPMYDVMHRAGIMQNPSALTRTFTMFKTVPLQQQNMIRRAVGEAQAANTPEAVSKARSQVASTAAALVVATLGYEGVEFFNQMLKNAAKGYRDDDDDDKLTAKSVLKTLAENSVKDLAGMTIGGKDLADVLMNSFGDVDYYETAAPGLSQMMDLKTAAEETMETFKTVLSDTKNLKEHGGSLKQYVKENGNDLLGDVKDTATLLAELSKGVPVPNLEKYLLGTLQWTSPELREEYKTLWGSTNKRDLTGLSGGALRMRVGKLMDLRVDNLSDEAKDELARLYESVGAEVIPSDVPSTIHMDDEDASLTRTMRQTYQNAYGRVLQDNLEKLLSSKSYQNMSDQAKSAAVTDLYDYAKAVAAEKTVGKEMIGGAKKAAGVIADGGELPDYLHFCATVGEKNAAERLEYLNNTNYSEASKAAIYLNALASDSKQEAWVELKQQSITKEEFYRYALVVNGQTTKADLLRAMESLSLSDDKKATLYFTAEASDSEKEKLAAAEKEGVSGQAYFQYLIASAGMTKKAEKLVAINSLDLTVNQKNALYYSNGWAKSTLYNAPWYDIMPRLSSRGGSSRRTSGGGMSIVKTGTALDKYRLGKYSLDKYDIMPKL